jgi:hypothetical protein
VQITPAGLDAYREVLELERSGTGPTVGVSDPEALRRLLLELVRSHS